MKESGKFWSLAENLTFTVKDEWKLWSQNLKNPDNP